jgi:2-polyprenyl-3-methyl-5-hydroxy-6-metoxy-1,4-benzoquinol methylase
MMKPDASQREYWNKIGYTKTFAHPFNIKQFSILIQKNQKILDFGCGYGRICEELWEHGYDNILGVDTAEKMIERGKEKYPQLPLQVFEKDFHDNSFDAVILFTVLTSVPKNGDQEALIRMISRILKKGGILYISDLWLQDDDRNRKRYKESEGKYGIYGVFELSEGLICRHHSELWIKELLSDFEQIDLIDMDVITMNGNKAKGFQYFGRKL